MKALSLRSCPRPIATACHALKGIDLDVEQGELLRAARPNGAQAAQAMRHHCVRWSIKPPARCRFRSGHRYATLEAAKGCWALVPQEINFKQFEKVSTIPSTQAVFYGILAASRGTAWRSGCAAAALGKARVYAVFALAVGGMKRGLNDRACADPRAEAADAYDEPTAGVDHRVRARMWEFCAKLERSTAPRYPDDALAGRGETSAATSHHRRGTLIEHDRMATVLRSCTAEVFVLTCASAGRGAGVARLRPVKLADDGSMRSR